MAKKKILLVGESWTSTTTHIKGFDQFATVSFGVGAEPLIDALKDSPYELVWMKAHEAAADFPVELAGLGNYAGIILSDIGSNTLLLHPDVWFRGEPRPNRLALIRDYVRAGGGLIMMGGYYSYQGINGGARYHRTPVEEALPIECLPYDDRVEVPEGFRAELVRPEHPVLKGIGRDWPLLLGLNEVRLKPHLAEMPDPAVAELLARVPDAQGGYPLLVAGSFGDGRSIAWTSDIGPHWLPKRFSDWPGYRKLWVQALDWLTEKRGGGRRSARAARPKR